MARTAQQEFGGVWTADKLKRLKGYIDAYMVILRKHPYLHPIYLDTFAGTGNLTIKDNDDIEEATLEEKGSARIALEVVYPFSKYIFVEKSRKKCEELENLKLEYPHHAPKIFVQQEDATVFLTKWCLETNWEKTRAVVFLDPFGMQVEWPLLETLAKTEAIDLWLLVPIGMGANRMMPRENLPSQDWADKLTRFFGNEDWKERFYRTKSQQSLFNEGEEEMEKNTNMNNYVTTF
jgi:three-Cys-motif partner protein